MKHLLAVVIGLGVGGATLLEMSGLPAGQERTDPAAPKAGKEPRTFQIPPEPPDVNARNPEEALPSFDEFCWESFLALNLAAAKNSRGEAEDEAKLAQPGERTVWSTWMSREDLYRSPSTHLRERRWPPGAVRSSTLSPTWPRCRCRPSWT
jgi:hypothetical protein